MTDKSKIIKEFAPCAHIEGLKNGKIKGWAAVNELVEDNICDLYIDNHHILTFSANIYREDLKDEYIREGVGGFLVAVPNVLCDGKVHVVDIVMHETTQKLYTKNLKLSNIQTFSYLQEGVLYDYIHHPYTEQKPVVLLAGFSEQNKLLNYQKYLIDTLRNAGLYVVYIIASNTPEELTGAFKTADRVIIRNNNGYDFGSWATGLLRCQKELYQTEDIYFVNDSIIGSLGSIQPLLKTIEQQECDIWAITGSHDVKYHFQSYFWGLKKSKNSFTPILDEFFFYRHPLPQSKQEAIHKYEIEGLSFFTSRELSVDILFPEYQLAKLADAEFLVDLDEHLRKWSSFFDLPIKNAQLASMQSGLINYADIMMNQLATNPSHMFWHVLIKQGFPFVKKELISLNPANYPFPQQFRVIFEETGMTHLLDDLYQANKFSRVV